MTLHEAALRGDCAELRRLIAAGDPIDGKDDDGQTVLFVAAAFEQSDAVECLLQNGADVRIRNGSGKTPLHGAAEAGKRGSIELLLAHGADIDARDNGGRSALFDASSAEAVDTAVCLATAS